MPSSVQRRAGNEFGSVVYGRITASEMSNENEVRRRISVHVTLMAPSDIGRGVRPNSVTKTPRSSHWTKVLAFSHFVYSRISRMNERHVPPGTAHGARLNLRPDNRVDPQGLNMQE